MLHKNYSYMANQQRIPAAWHYVLGTFSLSCLIFGFISNGFVILIFMRNKRLRRARNFFLINLAITDLGLLLTNNAMHAIASFQQHWIFGRIGCYIYAICGGICGLTSIATMTAISLIRLSAVLRPLNSRKLSSSFTKKCLLACWIHGSMWMIPPMFGWNRFVVENFGTSCSFDYVSKDQNDRSFTILVLLGGFSFPLLLLILSYALILKIVTQRSRRLTNFRANDENHSIHFYIYRLPMSRSISEETQRCSTAILHSNDDHYLIKTLHRTETIVIRNALLICLVFCLAWGPYASMIVLTQLNLISLPKPLITAFLGSLTKVAACVNPLIYALSSSRFRQYICTKGETC